MKAKLEETGPQYRGVILTSETDEELHILRDIWCGRWRAVSFGKLPDGNLEVVIAPTPLLDG